ncbi:MAG: primosomal protein N', partial [Leptospiraceae bacterium]|nr:primosomal protein N' [Leptospiraceae bacterium]
MFTVFVEVALRLPLARAYTYHLTSEQAGLVRAGMRVQVSFRNRTEEGLVLAVHSNPPEMLTLPVEKIIDSEPILNGYQLRLAQWMADYYLAGVGECLFKMFPRGRRYPAPQGRKKRKARNPAHDLNAEQSLVFERIQQDLMERSMRYAPESVTVAVDQMEKDNRATPSDRPPLHLIHGVTGSGKTEIYIHSILAALELNRGAILLVPEIALTVQLIERLRSVFGEELALLHSTLSGSMRFAAYMQLLRGEKQIAVGTRSAVFAPVQNPGIIIIDEEHDGSYREHSAPRYDARQVAYQRAREQGAVLLAGSATPRLEAAYNARVRGPETGSVYHVLQQRATGASLPAVHIVPMSAHDVPISGVLLKELEANYRAGQQSMLLLNRRGYHPGVYCRQCEQVQTCPSCSVALNLHRDG